MRDFKKYLKCGAYVLGGMLYTANVSAAVEISPGGMDLGTLSGFAETYFSANLQDAPEPGADGQPIGGQGELSMWRNTLLVTYTKDTSYFSLTAIGRIVREIETSYLEDLNDAPAQAGDLMEEYNEDELREYYVDVPFGRRTKLRFGRQQVIWGETDLFQALDLVHGRDQSWRSVYEPEEERVRKPLILANFMVQVPEAQGSAQLLYRPGWDDEEDIGHTVDLFGGRWAGQPNRGVNTSAVIPTNFHHSEADVDDPTFGARWNGTWLGGRSDYSIAYLRTFNMSPLTNFSAPALGETPYKGEIGANAGTCAPGVQCEFIRPKYDLVGGSLNYYSSALWDTVFRTEVAFKPEKAWNADPDGNGIPTILERQTVDLMVGFDTSFTWPIRAWGATAPARWSFQLFDTWITEFEDQDRIIDVGSSLKEEHSLTMVNLVTFDFFYDEVKPGITWAHDVSYGGGVVIPNLTLKYGNHWRFRLDAPIHYLSGETCATQVNGDGAECTHLFGLFDSHDQITLRIRLLF